MGRTLGLPLIGIAVFLVIWSLVAEQIHTSLGKFPGPVQVATQADSLYQEYERTQLKETAFYARQKERNAERMAKDPGYKPVIIPYTGQPTFFSQIGTSLFTVLSGFIIASLIAIPIGIAIGLSAGLYAAINPLIQLFRPVSPLAWLPLVTIVVSAAYVSNDPMFSKSYLVSMITVLLPSALPMMFTGLRLSLSIAWMVLIAAEMLAQNPGLGKFIWDQFQNGSSDSLSRIMVAVVVIGLIGFMLDRIMLLLQRWISWDKSAVLR
jgi:nitrate/nitrite transport system permease protein